MIWHDVLSKSLYIYTYRDTGITEMDPATGSIYLDDRGVDRHHRIIRNTHFVFPRCWSDALCPSVYRSTHFVWFIMAGDPVLSSNPLPMPLEPEPLIQMPYKVRRSYDDGLSAFFVHRFTTPWSIELRDALRDCHLASLEAMVVLTWRP